MVRNLAVTEKKLREHAMKTVKKRCKKTLKNISIDPYIFLNFLNRAYTICCFEAKLYATQTDNINCIIFLE